MDRICAGLLLLSLSTLTAPLRGAEPLDSLRLVTINVWSGLDYVGISTMGEYEPPTTRERRFQILLSQLRSLQPHLVMIQEANPVAHYAGRLADSLQFEEIHQVCHAGVKIAGLGVPSNFEEGIAILAAPALSLRFERAAKIGGKFGLHGSALSFHFNDAAVALEGSFIWGDKRIRAINVHLLAMPPSQTYALFEGDPDAAARLHERVELKNEQFESLADFVHQLSGGSPFVLGGDFNCQPGDSSFRECIHSLNLLTPFNFSDRAVTWDAHRNSNIAFTTAHVDARGTPRTGYDLYGAVSDSTPQRLDYIYLSPAVSLADRASERLVFSEPVDGVYASDHYGVAVTIPRDPGMPAGRADVTTPIAEPAIEAFPIVSYDTDVGFGYGAKGFLLNQLGLNESLDITAFNSTLGERWYRFVASFPDIETRQRTVYPVALDVIADYDKYIKNSFFGFGNDSQFGNREYYAREPFELSILLSRGFTESFVLQGGVRFQYVRNSDIQPAGLLAAAFPPLSQGIARSYALVVAGRYDTRNSVVQPSAGWLVETEVSRAPVSSAGSVLFTRFHALVQHYTTLFLPTTVLALRTKLSAIDGDLPVQMALPLGGNNTLRGFVQDRFLGKAVFVANAELRFPIFGRFGGVAALDAGNVWESLSLVGWPNWKWNPTAGIRFSMDTFVVRCDVGFGSETTGVYLNFGQIY